MTDLEWMNLAVQEAKLALQTGDVPVGALVVCDNVCIAKAHNEREARNDPTAHAEILALRKAAQVRGNWRLTGCTLFVTHEPCPMCAGAAVMSGIHSIVFGCCEDKTGACGSQLNLVQFPGFPHNVRIRGPIDEERCAALMQDFFKQLR